MFRRNWFIAVVSLLFLLSVLVGCATENTGFTQPSPVKPGKVKYPLDLKDQTGYAHTFQQPSERIVSLVPSATEIIYAIKAQEKLVGVTTNDDYPAEVKKLPKVGDLTVNVEKVLELKPDLVIAEQLNGQETIDKLRKLGLTVFVLDADNIDKIFESIAMIGAITNHSYEADELVKQMMQKRLDIFRKIGKVDEDKKVKVWVEISPELHTAGKGTFIDELIQLSSGKNIAGGLEGWPQVTAEQVIQWQPDVIISLYTDKESILKRKGWEQIPAVKNKRVVLVDINLVARPGPRIFDGFEEIAKALYPDRVK
jgi:iron complex transport system substrate-binding protein